MIGCKPTWIIPISVTYRTTITDDVDISANVTGVDDRHIGSYITVLSMANHSLRQQDKGKGLSHLEAVPSVNPKHPSHPLPLSKSPYPTKYFSITMHITKLLKTTKSSAS